MPVPEIRELIRHFHRVASEGTPEEALAAFYAYESQVPRIAKEKERGLREMYGADDKTCGYFALHATADVYHSNVWRNQLEKRVAANPEAAAAALNAAENTARRCSGRRWMESKRARTALRRVSILKMSLVLK